LAAQLPLYGKPAQAMTGKYLVRNRLLVAALTLMDFVGRFRGLTHVPPPNDRPIRILLANWAHLGDVVITLPLLHFLANNPRVERVDVLIGSWSLPVLSTLPYIKKIHILDHYFLDRSVQSISTKLLRYCQKKRDVISEIKRIMYDVSIDLFPFFPSTHHLFWKANIPLRIGFDSSGGGNYLTHPFGWTVDDESLLVKQLRLLRPLFGDQTPLSLPAIYPGSKFVGLGDTRLVGQRYILLHVGSGDIRSWTIDNWFRLGQILMERGEQLVFTGAQGREAEIARNLADKLKAQCFAGRLSWDEFVSTVSGAAAIISVDTVTGHLAACFGVPSVVLLSGRSPSQLVRPNNRSVRTITHPVGCMPCYRSRGCGAMACVKLITVDDVISAFDEITKR
jgi:ADP-heptose:LPS heptosyltransferase